MYIATFAIGFVVGLYLYDKGWRAQTPFYKEDSIDA